MFNHETFNQTNTSFDGIFIGCIEDNKDSQKMGRVRVRIAGIHTPKKTKTSTSGIPTNELPWAIAANSLEGGSVSGIGKSAVPVQGSWVALFFIGGNHNNPVYFATISGMPQNLANSEEGFNDPDGVYPNVIGEPDWNKEARGEGTIKDIKNANLETYEPSSQADPEYPYNDVYEGQGNGLIIEHDNTPDGERWHVFHKASKSYLEIHPNGDMVMKSTNNKFEITTKDRKIFVKGNDTQKVDGNETTDIGGNLVINISGTSTINSTGKVIINGGTVDIDGGSGLLAGIVNGISVCHLTGLPIADVSSDCQCSK